MALLASFVWSSDGRGGRVTEGVPTGGASGRLTLLAFAALCSVLAPLNSTMIAVALPRIRDDFALAPGTVGWLVSGYLIAMAVAQPVAGRLGDQYGRGPIVRAGLLAFIAASVATAFAPNFAVLIALRVAQAVFGAGLIPNAMALLRERAPAGELGRLNGYNGVAIAAAAAAGPLLGAAALAAGSWRLVFPASLPFAIGALLLMPMLRLNRSSGPDRALAARRTDWLGTIECAGLLVAVTVLLGGARAWDATQVAGWIALAVGLAIFVQLQRRTSNPVAAWGLFRYRSFAAATTDVLLTNLAMYTTLLMVPFLVSDVLGAGASTSGVLLGVMSGFMGIASPLGGRVADLRGRRQAGLLGGALVLTAAALLFVVLLVGVTAFELSVLLAVLGAGVGIGNGAANTAAIESVPRARAGTAAGTSSMMRYVGSIVGAGVLSAALGSGGARPVAGTFLMLEVVIVLTAAGATLAAAFMHGAPPAEDDLDARAPGMPEPRTAAG